MKMAKISPELGEVVKKTAPDDIVEVVVELEPGEPVAPIAAEYRMDVIARQRDLFEHEVEPVVDVIHSVGGEVLQTAWINRTLLARVPKRGLSRLLDLDAVEVLDLPRFLEAEAG